MTASTMTRSRKNCGKCGASAPCKCCQPVCESFTDNDACKPSGFARPRFFAGQLLTEEDLQDLTGYMLAKNRLHNRYLFGAGVVCGLDVKKHPCKPREVNIGPGYALDCCGNDISVPCLVEGLDIIAMIQELRAGVRGGYDCGDPCAQKPTHPEKPSAAVGVIGGVAATVAVAAAARPQLYDLYIRYCERNTDLVAPYEFESCAAPGCQASRVEEGFKFELRCTPVECLQRTDPKTTQKSNYYAEAAEHGAPTLISQVDACMKDDAHKNLVISTFGALHTLETAHKIVVQGPLLRAIAEAELKKKIGESLVAAERQLASTDNPSDQLRIVHRGLVWVIRWKVRTFGPMPADLASATKALASKLSDLTSPASTVKDDATKVDALWKRFEPAPTTPDPDQPFNDNSAMAGELLTLKQVNDSLKTLDELRATILRLQADSVLDLDDSQKRYLRDHEFKSIAASAGTSEIKDRREQALKLAYIVYQNMQHCFCDSIAPPCLPCDDPGVLLARIEVDMNECRVVHVCDLQRRFIWTATALSYWLSPMRRWLDSRRALCCLPYEKRQPASFLQTALEEEAKDRWGSDTLNAATWRSVPVAEKSMDMMKELIHQVHLIAQVDVSAISDAMDPLGARTDPTTALADLRAEIEKLTAQVKTLKAATSQQAPATSTLREEWNRVSVETVTKKKSFLVSQFHSRLKDKGLKKTEEGSATAKSHNEVTAEHMKSFDKLPKDQRDDWISLTIPELLEKEASLLKPLGSISPEVEKFWREVHELDYLIYYWPEKTIDAGELTT